MKTRKAMTKANAPSVRRHGVFDPTYVTADPILIAYLIARGFLPREVQGAPTVFTFEESRELHNAIGFFGTQRLRADWARIIRNAAAYPRPERWA